MKKLIVIVMAVVGFVTVASADEQLTCTNGSPNQCCIDLSNIQSAISQALTHTIITTDNYPILFATTDLYNDDAGNCKDLALYFIDRAPKGVAFFEWQPGNWANTIAMSSNPSSANQ